ncbi:MAG: hypothetical protein IJS53_01885 [Clostridia bacterium]|nr:hypothetical protein [Clostridia bacterium]
MKKLCIILIALLLFAALPAHAEDEAYLKEQESWNHVVTVLGKTYLVFAQNSPEWADLRINNNPEDPMYAALFACKHFAFANAAVNVVPYELLPDILEIMRFPVRIDRVTVTHLYTRSSQYRFEIKENCDYLRYFPLILISYAAGNNDHWVENPTNAFYADEIPEHYGIRQEFTWDVSEGLDALKAGALVMTNFYGYREPDAQVYGHSIVLVACDEEYAYMLDSNFYEEFPQPAGYYVEMVELGVQRIRLEDIPKINVGRMNILWPHEDFVNYTAERYQEIIDESNSLVGQ